MKVELESVTDDAENVIERAARTCYQSESKGEPGKLIKALIKSGHHSVLEHASATFRINGVSRAMTHQLVRHRICAFSQQSQRYVNETQFDYVIPPSIKKDPGLEAVFKVYMEDIQEMYNHFKRLGIKNEDARFVLPNACCSEIVITANFREWRHIFELRCDKHAQWEIREVMLKIIDILNLTAPSVFGDLVEKFSENQSTTH